MKILVFGKGFIGLRMLDAWSDATWTSADISNRNEVNEALASFAPDVVINAAGKTGRPNVDWCETNQCATARPNVVGAITLAEECAERGVYLLHLGSGCVFYGDSPDPAGWREDDFANPISFYSRTKYATDLVLSQMPNIGIARLRMPIDHTPSPRNLITKLAAYRRVIDAENSVTIVDDFVKAARGMIDHRAAGIFHVVNQGTMRHRDLLALYQKYVDPKHSCQWLTPEQLVSDGLVSKPRSNCILQSKRLDDLGISLRPVAEALEATMRGYGEAIKRADAAAV